MLLLHPFVIMRPSVATSLGGLEASVTLHMDQGCMADSKVLSAQSSVQHRHLLTRHAPKLEKPGTLLDDLESPWFLRRGRPGDFPWGVGHIPW